MNTAASTPEVGKQPALSPGVGCTLPIVEKLLHDCAGWGIGPALVTQEAAKIIVDMFEALENSVSALCSLRKSYEEELGIWEDVSRFIREGNAALARARGEA
jgi:hypothetical protein